MRKTLFYILSPVLVPVFYTLVIVSGLTIEIAFYIADFAEWAKIRLPGFTK